jgi:hypothetical protein
MLARNDGILGSFKVGNGGGQRKSEVYGFVAA